LNDNGYAAAESIKGLGDGTGRYFDTVDVDDFETTSPQMVDECLFVPRAPFA
jgi:hypothetical protein